MTLPESLPSAPPGLEAASLEFDGAFSDLTHTLQELLATTTAHERVNALYLEYASLVQAALAGHDVQPNAAHAYAQYIQALQAALSSMPHQQHAVDAFERYVRAVRTAWIGIDPGIATPAVVAVMAQQLLTAASAVAGIGSPQTAVSGGVSPPLLPAQD